MISFSTFEPRLRAHAEATVAYAGKLGFTPSVISVRRSEAEQLTLYSEYKAGLRQWPAAKPGDSAHQWGVAFDSTVPDRYLETWKAVRRAFGWFVPDGDPNHAEFPGWQRYKSKLRYS